MTGQCISTSCEPSVLVVTGLSRVRHMLVWRIGSEAGVEFTDVELGAESDSGAKRKSAWDTCSKAGKSFVTYTYFRPDLLEFLGVAELRERLW